MTITILEPKRADEWLRDRKKRLVELVGLRHEQILLQKKIRDANQELSKLDSELVGEDISFGIE